MLKSLYERYQKLFWEIVRYLIVGGLATVVDYGLFFLMYELVLPSDFFIKGFNVSLAIANTIGFIGGLIFNYILSISFVFKDASDKDNGKSVKGFVIFAVIGIFGLIISNIGMQILVEDLGIHVLLSKIIMTVIVLVWNYLGRKVLIFR